MDCFHSHCRPFAFVLRGFVVMAISRYPSLSPIAAALQSMIAFSENSTTIGLEKLHHRPISQRYPWRFRLCCGGHRR